MKNPEKKNNEIKIGLKPAFILFFLILLLFLNSCKKYDKEGSLTTPGIVLTFDDNYIDEWYHYMGLFDSFQVKATFYISYYNQFTESQKQKLHELQSHGHEIAYHSVNHPDFIKYLNKYGMGRLEKEEIIDGLSLMNKDGFYPTDFAYPYGKHNVVIDNMIFKWFKSYRALNGTSNYSKSLITNFGNSELYALGIDISSGKKDKQLIELINSAHENNDCLVLVGHHINREDLKLQVPYKRLYVILKRASELKMKFYRVDQITP